MKLQPDTNIRTVLSDYDFDFAVFPRQARDFAFKPPVV